MICGGVTAMAATRHNSGSKAKAERVDRSLKRREQMYALMEAHPESAEELHGRVKAANKSAPLVDAKVSRAVRKAEASTLDRKRAIIRDGVEDVGTGQTILKQRKKPVQKLVDDKKIGQDELDAAAEIEQAFTALASRLMVRGMTFERVDHGGYGSDGHFGAAARAVANYTRWAKHWSARANLYCDPTLEIVIAAVIDERPTRTIGADIGFGHQRVEDALVCGLQDYAARSGFVNGGLADKWIKQAEKLFVSGNTALLDAVRRAKIER